MLDGKTGISWFVGLRS